MGVPVAARNIFPSNIQGLPTWYEVRVVEAGWRGRRGGVDLMVAMNPETWDEDVIEIEPGGYLFYDSTKPLPPSKFRDDITVVAMPLMEICNATYTDPRQRQLFKNIIYLGALAGLLGIEPEVDRGAARGAVQGQGAAARVEPQGVPARLRLRGARTSRRSASRSSGATRSATGSSSTATTRRRWAPSTAARRSARGIRSRRRRRSPRPSPSTASGIASSPATGRNRYAIVQAEDELASIGMVIGGAWNGARSFTATVGARHLADAGIHRARVLRRDPGGALRRAARQPVDRHADEDAAGRPPDLRVRVARRHQARAAVPRGPEGVLRDGRAGVRPRRPAADAGVRDAGPRHRHAGLAVRAVHVGRQRAGSTAAR